MQLFCLTESGNKGAHTAAICQSDDHDCQPEAASEHSNVKLPTSCIRPLRMEELYSDRSSVKSQSWPRWMFNGRPANAAVSRRSLPAMAVQFRN